jgi:ribosomal protein S1
MFTDTIVLSYRKVIEKAKWDVVQEIFKNAEWLLGTIIKTVKSGFLVDVGVSAFFAYFAGKLLNTKKCSKSICFEEVSL